MAIRERWDWRRVLLFMIPVSAAAAVLGAVFGWLADGSLGAVVGALVMALVFAPIAVLIIVLFRPAGPLDN